MLKFVRVFKTCCRLTPLVLAGEVLINAKPIVFSDIQTQKSPLTSDLTQKSLIKNASSVAVDAVCSLLSQITIALAESEQTYAKCIEEVVESIDHVCSSLGKYNETQAWDRLLNARAQLEDARRERQSLLLLMTSVEQSVNSVAVTSFEAEAEYAGIIAGERLVSTKTYLKTFQEHSAAAETRLNMAEVKSIEATGEHYEKIKQQKSKEDEEGQRLSEDTANHHEDHEVVGDYDSDDAK